MGETKVVVEGDMSQPQVSPGEPILYDLRNLISSLFLYVPSHFVIYPWNEAGKTEVTWVDADLPGDGEPGQEVRANPQLTGGLHLPSSTASPTGPWHWPGINLEQTSTAFVPSRSSEELRSIQLIDLSCVAPKE